MKKVVLHGECMVISDAVIPANVKKVNVNKDYIVVADSETTGNHHVVDVFSGVDFFEDDKGTLFMQNSLPTNIRCVMEDRHDSITLEPGKYQFGFQQEYDYFEEALRNVRD